VAILVTIINNIGALALTPPEVDPSIIQRLDPRGSYLSRKEPPLLLLQLKDRHRSAEVLEEEDRKAEVISEMKFRW
jgi:hypothetical protein